MFEIVYLFNVRSFLNSRRETFVSLMWTMCALHSIALMSSRKRVIDTVCRIQMAVSTDLKVDETDELVEMNHLCK